MVLLQSILPLVLQALKEGPTSNVLTQLKGQITSNNQPYIIAIDFDGTLCQNNYPEIGRENDKLIAAIPLMQSMGILVVLWTCRENEDLDKALAWCQKHNLQFDAVNENCSYITEQFQWNTRKIHADEYWDDHAVSISFSED